MGYFLWHLGRRDQLLPTGREVAILQRFSQASLLAVALLLATGMINGWLMVGTWQNLTNTWNGKLLLGKLLIVTIMIGVGAFNRFLLMPRIHDLPVMFRTLRGTIVAESFLGLLVLCIVGLHH
jgi:putative copper export protein